MKFIIILLSFFLNPFCIAESYRANFFPTTEEFYSAEYIYESTSITPTTASVDTREDTRHHLNNIFAKKLTVDSYLAIELPFSIIREDDRDAGAERGSRVNSKGFGEPTFLFSKRLQTMKNLGDPIQDIYIAYSPSIFEREVGSDGYGLWRGAHMIELGGSFGAIYELWEAKVFGSIHYLSELTEKDLKQKSTLVYDEQSSYTIGIEFQYEIHKGFYLNASSALNFNQTFDVYNDQTDEISTVQQGTGSSAHIGGIYKSGLEQYALKLTRVKNDFFIENKSTTNFSGDLRTIFVEFSFLRNF